MIEWWHKMEIFLFQNNSCRYFYLFFTAWTISCGIDRSFIIIESKFCQFKNTRRNVHWPYFYISHSIYQFVGTWSPPPWSFAIIKRQSLQVTWLTSSPEEGHTSTRGLASPSPWQSCQPWPWSSGRQAHSCGSWRPPYRERNSRGTVRVVLYGHSPRWDLFSN